ncbi:ProQ/FinO family protein [Trinickia caryophylli]|uniref:ProP effector n=1 Tax=Trinickia caryophylli TaxID=28094 RepID=A0A1X7D702_TRICW|nr:ProQ/FinO family protein [Trinickia caryophylli]PMS12665.1 prop effector [Trinickia caryophylli]TRX15071.1 prop effector [Trinickia caryophylli]WQE14930.1 ProQ/FinO family protein [Trinickia caryophylli]SMF09982.1 ProP effector [Trinickia caryophylli]GLU31342.1 hypothetical protein Busp01_11840 [Trinickia caryophylli]
MGFEQLAELKKQLAKEARDAKEAKRQSAPAGGAKPRRHPAPGKPAATAQPDKGQPGHAQPAKSQQAEGQPGRGQQARSQQAKAEPVDPVVRIIGKLQRRFPAAFPKNPAPKVPLKIGILADLLAHAAELSLSEAEIRDAVSTWCRGNRYWACLVEGAARVDLTGAPAGEVTARDAAFARNKGRHAPRQRRKSDAAPTANNAAAPEGASAPESESAPEGALAPESASVPESASAPNEASAPEGASASGNPPADQA